MPRYEVEIPGRGRFEVESPEPLSDEQAYAAAIQQIQAGKIEKPAEGILAALGKGAESTLSQIRAGVKGIYAPEEAAREAKARGEEIGRRYADQVSLEKVKEAYRERGLLPAAGEAISQIPAALAEQAPNIGAALAGGRAGAMLGTPLGPAGAIAGGFAGAFLPSFLQQAGGNIQRQAEEAVAQGEKPEISRAAAFGAAAPQAALDVVGTFIPLGRSLIGKALGPAVEKALSKGADAAAEKLAKDSLTKTLLKGTLIGGIAEVPTEVAQQMLERLQAGLPLTDESALEEYGETAYQVGLLAPIGAAGRVVERGEAQRQIELKSQEKAAETFKRQREEAKAAEAAAEAQKQTPEYAIQFATEHEALQKEYDDLGAQLKQKLPAGASFADRQAVEDLKKRRAELKEQLIGQAAEYNRVKPLIEKLRQQQEAQAAQAAKDAQAAQQQRMQEEQLAGPMQQLTIPGMEPPTLKVPEKEITPEEQRAQSLKLTQDRQSVEKLLEDNQQAQSDAVERGDFDLRRRLAGQRTALQAELNYINTQLKKTGLYIDEIAKAQKLQAQLDKAREDLKAMSGPGFDPAVADKLDTKIQKLEAELSQYDGVQQALDLGKAEPLKGLPPQAARAEFAARKYQPGAPDIEAQEAALREEEARAEEERLAEERREQKIAPESLALQRIGAREPVIVGEKDIYGPTVDRIVESIVERQQPAFAGRIVVGEGTQIVDRGDTLRAQLAYARITNNKERIEELKKRLADLKEPEIEVKGTAVELGEQAKRLGVEGRETPATMAANRVTRLSQAQLNAYDRLSNFINSVREREVPSDENRVKTLKEIAYKLRDTVVGLALNEADARLAQIGKPALNTDQQLQLVAGIERPLNELIQRGALAFMPPVAQRAQMRGARIVMGAEETQAGKRLFGSFPAASNTIRAQVRSVLDKTVGVKVKLGKPYKVEGLRVQFSETAKERTEDQLFKQAFENASDAETRQLEQIEKALPYVDNKFVRDSIMESVRDKADGKALTLDDRAKQTIAALQRAVEDEGAQAELFPGATTKAVTRATAGKFQRFLDSAEVAKLRAKQAEYNKQAAYLAKMAAGIEARIEAERKAAEDYVNSLTAGKAKTPAEAAERAFQTAVDKNAEAVRIADDINKRRWQERTRIAAMIVELERGKTVAQKKVDELAELGEYLSNQMLIKPKDKKIEAAAIDLDKQLKKAVKDYQAVIAATDKAKALQTKILEAHANDTIDNSLIKAGAKAQERIDKARTELSAAREAEAAAKRAVEAVNKERVTETEEQRRQRALLYPSAGITRTVVVRDTSDPNVQAKVKDYRGIIAKKEEEHVVAVKQLDMARNTVVKAEADLAKARKEREGVTQAQKDLETARAKVRTAEAAVNAIALSIEKTYRNVYAALDNAPLRQFEIASKEDVQAFEQYEESQRRLADAELKASFAEKGLAEPKTPERRKLGPVAKVQSGAPTTMRTGTEESRAGLTTRGQSVGARTTTVEATEAELERLNKTVQRSVLGDIAAKRVELNTINNQIKFIVANPKGTTRTGKPKLTPKQEEAKRTAEARKQVLQAELTKLVEEQKTVVKQAQERKAAGKALRTETRKLARSEVKETGEISEERELSKETLEQLAATATQGPALKEKVDTEDNAAAVMQNIAKTTSSDITRAVTERLKILLGNTRVEIVNDLRDPDGQAAYGQAAADGSFIRLDSKHGLNERTAVHEGVHAATERVIQMPEDQLTPEQLRAKRELEELFAAYKKLPNATNKNAKTSLSEFISEALSDDVMQAEMRAKPWTLKHMWESFKSAILDLLGIKTPKNMLEATLAAADNLMTRVPRPTAADNALLGPKLLNRPRGLNPELNEADEISRRLIAKNQTAYQKFRANGTGLAFETQAVDRFAGFERLSKYLPGHRGSQMMFYLRMHDQRMNFTAQSVGNGYLVRREITRKDGQKEYVIESSGDASIAKVAQILKRANPLVGDVDAASRLFTLYLVHNRAKRVGFNKLDISGQITERDLNAAVQQIESIEGLKDIFDQARAQYNEYNEGMIRFLQDSGVISKALADKLLKEKDYIPWYRSRGGNAELLIGGESPIKLGNIKDIPQLQELVGGDQPVLDFMISSVMNTNMITDLALNNLAKRNAVFEFVDIGAAKITNKPISGPDVVKFKLNGEDMYAMLDTERITVNGKTFDTGVPADLLVKGMEGIPTQFTGVLRMMSLPTRLLRKSITLSPLYSANQLVRDSTNAFIAAGMDAAPVLSALKEIGKGSVLERRGITGGQVFSGTTEDLSRILKRVAGGKSYDLIGKLETMTMEADALTRRAQYNSYIKQGMSEMEATLLALESMNFNKRGASPSIHFANSMIPFFNAQIQGLNVLYKAMFGQLSPAEKVRIKQKLITRGALMMCISLAYTAAMQDDEAYKNAQPEEKYGNWFVRIPGVSEPIKIPVPFEIGYIFKALPEALYNTAMNEHGSDEAIKAFRTIIQNTIPGGSSYFIPQIFKPAIEAAADYSFFTGRSTLSDKEKSLLPEYQYRENTTELAKLFGRLAGVSPIKIEGLVQGYTGTMGMALMAAVSAPFVSSDTPEQATKRLSDIPVVGKAFQPNDAQWIISNTYDQLKDAEQTRNSFNELLKRGDKAEALRLVNERSQNYARAELAGYYRQQMGELTQAEAAVKASDMSKDRKREMLDQLRQYKIKLSAIVRDASDTTKLAVEAKAS